MKILVIGGTRFFGIPMITRLLDEGNDITVATRGITPDTYGNRVKRITLNIYDSASVKEALSGKVYDVVIDKMGYGSLDVRNILDSVECGRFIHMSTAGIYKLDHRNIQEQEFDGKCIPLKWCSRGDDEYDEVKRQAEAALCQKYAHLDWASVRCPYVLGKNDYTKRLLFYVDHIMKEIPMNIDNVDEQLCFANEEEMGIFLAYLADKDKVQGINACAKGTMSIREILTYVENKTGYLARINNDGEEAPYNGTLSNSLCTEKARRFGFEFKNLYEWVPELLDYYIECVRKERKS